MFCTKKYSGVYSVTSPTILVLEHKKTTAREHFYSCMVLFLLSPLEDVTQKLFFLQSLSEGFFTGTVFFLRLPLTLTLYFSSKHLIISENIPSFLHPLITSSNEIPHSFSNKDDNFIFISSSSTSGNFRYLYSSLILFNTGSRFLSSNIIL